MELGIIGQGFVGNAIYQKFKKFYNVLTYDIKKELSNSTLRDIKLKCKLFYMFPTPMSVTVAAIFQ